MANLPSLWGRNFPLETRDPYRSFARFRQDIDDMFESFLRESWDENLSSLNRPSMSPFEMEDRENHFLLSFDVPGMTKEDIKVEVRDNQLHVCGSRKEEREQRHGRRVENEKSYGAFDRWLTIPQNANAEAIEARVENGVLQIAIPKTQVSSPREIKVGEGKTGFFSKLVGKKEQVA